ncbi:unnamed protein product, partial [Larinioides sclopetarius]
MKVSKDDLQEPPYGVEGDETDPPDESPKIVSPKMELTPKECLDFLESPQINIEIPSTKLELSPEQNLGETETTQNVSPKLAVTLKESLDFLGSPQVNAEITSSKLDLYLKQNLDGTETTQRVSPLHDLKMKKYQLVTLYKADDPAYEHFTSNDDADDEYSSCSSSEYFTCTEDNLSITSSSDSEMPESEFRAFESEMNSIYMNMKVLAQRLREACNDQNQNMQSDIVRFEKKFK